MIIVDSAPKFEPQTITFETEGEVRLFRDFLGRMTGPIEKAYGIPSTYETFTTLDELCKTLDIHQPDVEISVSINK